MHRISLNTNMRVEFIDITAKLQEIVSKSKVQSGICFVYCPHTTAAITINEGADISVRQDIISKLNELIPENSNYSHLEGNSDAHIKASIIGSNIAIPIADGKLSLGRWQAVYFCEFDGPRSREVVVKLIRDD